MIAEKDLITIRGKIIRLAESGMKPLDIATHLGLGKSTVYKWIKRYKDEISLECYKRTGRPRKTTMEQDKMIVLMAEENPFIILKSIQQSLSFDVSKMTIKKRLKEAGYQHRKKC